MSGPPTPDTDPVARAYRHFADVETGDRSPLYVELGRGIADDPAVLALLAALPPIKQQPNLLLSAVRYSHGTVENYPDFRAYLLGHWDDIRTVMITRRTQTNEVARCATLLPLLAALPQPLAICEVGASAGLCLLLDRYHYRYDTPTGAITVGPSDSPVRLRCATAGPVPIPTELPDVVWRRGLDLAPIDIADPQEVRWLQALVWPGENDRTERLAAALELARSDPPPVLTGDLTRDLADAVADAPPDATLVVFHSAAVTYVPAELRPAFVSDVGRLGATWVSNESPHVFPDLAARLAPGERDAHPSDFLLCCDGQPVGWTDHHGMHVQWRAPRQ